MSNTFYIVAGWIVVLGGSAAYATIVVLRGRALSLRVPVERRRWSSSSPNLPGPTDRP